MCLAVPGLIVAKRGDDAVVDMQGNRVCVSCALTPSASVGAWVLVHAGFAIATLSAAAARATWDYLREADDLWNDTDDRVRGDGDSAELTRAGGAP
ncbi:MAG: HypC/HybG/HupF family hydrogenase formation chaperone [Phycisphaerae bacterium]